MLTIGITTYNALKYTKMCVQAIRANTETEHRIFVVDGGSTDGTREWLKDEGIEHINHDQNYGGAYAMNDLLDFALQDEEDALLVCGNDTMCYPGAIDRMMETMRVTGADWVWAHEMRITDWLALNPQDGGLFDNRFRLQGESFPQYLHMKQARHAPYRYLPTRDYRNFTLIRKSLFDKVGYADVNYWPAGYYEDPDYCRRALIRGALAVHSDAWFFHFWSRTIFEGGEGRMEEYGRTLTRNRSYYYAKWGGLEGNEAYIYPFGNKPINISSRENEKQIVEYWRNLENPVAL